MIIIDLDHMFWDYEEEKINSAKMELNEILIEKEDYYNKRYQQEKGIALTKKM